VLEAIFGAYSRNTVQWFKFRIAESLARVIAPAKFFLFFRGAIFGQFHPIVPAQVVCGSPIGAWQ
jgi:hypothetical protein